MLILFKTLVLSAHKKTAFSKLKNFKYRKDINLRGLCIIKYKNILKI